MATPSCIKPFSKRQALAQTEGLCIARNTALGWVAVTPTSEIPASGYQEARLIAAKHRAKIVLSLMGVPLSESVLQAIHSHGGRYWEECSAASIVRAALLAV